MFCGLPGNWLATWSSSEKRVFCVLRTVFQNFFSFPSSFSDCSLSSPKYLSQTLCLFWKSFHFCIMSSSNIKKKVWVFSISLHCSWFELYFLDLWDTTVFFEIICSNMSLPKMLVMIVWGWFLLLPFARSLNSRLNPITRLSCQNTLFGKIWRFTFFLTLLYIYPYTHDSKRASRENFGRETLEKIRLIHPQSLPKRLFKFLYSLPLHCQILERLFIKRFSHHIHFCEMAIWCYRKQLGRNQFHIGWCYGQVAESGKLEKK